MAVIIRLSIVKLLKSYSDSLNKRFSYKIYFSSIMLRRIGNISAYKKSLKITNEFFNHFYDLETPKIALLNFYSRIIVLQKKWKSLFKLTKIRELVLVQKWNDRLKILISRINKRQIRYSNRLRMLQNLLLLNCNNILKVYLNAKRKQYYKDIKEYLYYKYTIVSFLYKIGIARKY